MSNIRCFSVRRQSVQRIEDRRKRPSAVMRQPAGYVLKEQIARVPGFSQAGKFKEEGASGVSESLATSSKAESLAGKSTAEQVEVGHGCGVGFSGIFDVPLSFRVKQRVGNFFAARNWRF